MREMLFKLLYNKRYKYLKNLEYVVREVTDQIVHLAMENIKLEKELNNNKAKEEYLQKEIDKINEQLNKMIN
jgi:hypothetical protein